jgi:hypothetical protein
MENPLETSRINFGLPSKANVSTLEAKADGVSSKVTGGGNLTKACSGWP